MAINFNYVHFKNNEKAHKPRLDLRDKQGKTRGFVKRQRLKADFNRYMAAILI